MMDIKGRPSRDMVLMGICDLWASRSTCSRAALGAILVWENRIISTGYNGAPAGMPHCDHSHDGMDPDFIPDSPTRPTCRTSVHAEANAIAFAARYGARTEHTTMYCTLTPCIPCAQLIINAGIYEVVYKNAYRDPAGVDLLTEAGVELRMPQR